MANTRLFRGTLFLAILVLLSCKDDLGSVGIKSPNGDFQVFVKEFTLPTKVMLVDSVNTSYGNVSSDGSLKTVAPARFMCGSVNDPVFGQSTAIAYTQYYAASYPLIPTNAVFKKLTLTLVFDYYWYGDESASTQQFDIYEVTDSILTYAPHYSNESTPYGRLLGTTSSIVSPSDFDLNYAANRDDDTTNDIYDSLNVAMDETLGRALLQAAIDTVGTNELNYNYFKRFRRIFKGLAITSPNSNKVVGFDPTHAKTRMVLDYSVDTTKFQLIFPMTPPLQANGTGEYMSYTEFRNDRSGTAVAALTTPYVPFEPSTGMRYAQAGSGIVTTLDLSEVIDHFKNIPVKALSVAELRIETDVQKKAPTSFTIRALTPGNYYMRSSVTAIDAADDPYKALNLTLLSKHMLSTRTDGGYGGPYYDIEPLGDDSEILTINQSTTDAGFYSGYLTNFLQQELTLTETDFLRYWALIPYNPGITRGINGFYFPADKIKLKIYYTTPGLKE